MKFGKELEQTLIEEEIPEEWVGAAIQYKVLKKCINKVVAELKLLGLEQNTLKLLLENPHSAQIVEVDESHTTPTNPVIAEYLLSKLKHSDVIRPKLKITIDYGDTEYTDDHIAELGRELRAKIEHLLNDEEGHGLERGENIVELTESNQLVLSPQLSRARVEAKQGDRHQHNEFIIVLNSDSKFFQMLDAELENLDKLRTEEERKLIGEVESISAVVKSLTDPKVSTSDMYKWREIFRIYLDLEVFFRYNESLLASLERSLAQIKQHLDEFMLRVSQTAIAEQFKRKQARKAFTDFVAMNYHLFKILQFQSINSKAFTKILKKFDKQTSLGIKHEFPKLISSDHVFITGASLAQKICFVMQLLLLQLVPQLEDYMCPICCLVAFKPIKLNCGHVFCVTCLVKMKREDKTNCPLCRYELAVALADSSNLDLKRQQLIQTYFPLEVKEKLKERDQERYHEMVGKGKCAIQ